MCDDIEKVLLPGYVLKLIPNDKNKKNRIILGPGLVRHDDQVVVTKAGILRHKEPRIFWIDSHQKRYVPARGENVLGIVTNRGGDVFRVDIGASEHASLSYLAFESATKRNRPDVKVGDLVYCRLIQADKDMEPELVCIDSQSKSAGMGVIRDGGFLCTASLNLIRKILSPDCVLLKTLGKNLPFEIAAGMNGRLWVKGRSNQETIVVVNTILDSEYLDNDQMKTLCRRAVQGMPGV